MGSEMCIRDSGAAARATDMSRSVGAVWSPRAAQSAPRPPDAACGGAHGGVVGLDIAFDVGTDGTGGERGEARVARGGAEDGVEDGALDAEDNAGGAAVEHGARRIRRKMRALPAELEDVSGHAGHVALAALPTAGSAGSEGAARSAEESEESMLGFMGTAREGEQFSPFLHPGRRPNFARGGRSQRHGASTARAARVAGGVRGKSEPIGAAAEPGGGAREVGPVPCPSSGCHELTGAR